VFVDKHYKAKIESKIAEFRDWSSEQTFSECRLIQYCGVDLVHAISVPLTQVEQQIEGLLSEAFYVDWEASEGRLYLKVWEFEGPEPDWPMVFAERPLADVDAVLRKAGHRTQ
jgi:hypothetical protein